jgi:SAM-dependent methyltransferase
MNTYRDLIYTKYASVIKKYPRTFDETGAQAWSDAFSRYLKGWLPDNRDANIVDLGCGSGRFLYLLRKFGYTNVTGVDVSEEQVLLAKQINKNVIVKDVLSFLRNDTTSYELIAAFDLIEHLTKEEFVEFFSLVEKRLRNRGRLIINTPNAASPFGLYRRYGDFTHEICFTPSCLGDVLALFGLCDAEARELGPYPHGILSLIRYLCWKVVRLVIASYNLIEIGNLGGRIYTRDFVMSVRKLDNNDGGC